MNNTNNIEVEGLIVLKFILHVDYDFLDFLATFKLQQKIMHL